jgi:hypothetical protein
VTVVALPTPAPVKPVVAVRIAPCCLQSEAGSVASDVAAVLEHDHQTRSELVVQAKRTIGQTLPTRYWQVGP